MSRCAICNCTDSKPIYSGIERCHVCGHVFCTKSSVDGTLSEIYGKGYFFGGEYSDYLADKKITQDDFKLRMKTLRKFLNINRHKRLLEIGCAYGLFLDVARPYFERVNGIDVSREALLYAEEKLGLDVVSGDLLAHDFGSQKFDVVCMWDTIEHLDNPFAYLVKISKELTDKGALVAITTGDIDSLNARIKKDKWRLMSSPTHLHYFSKRTLTRLLVDNGFDVVYSGYCGFYRSIDMAAHRISLAANKGRWFYELLRKSGLAGIQFYLNLYDIMYIIARKR